MSHNITGDGAVYAAVTQNESQENQKRINTLITADARISHVT